MPRITLSIYYSFIILFIGISLNGQSDITLEDIWSKQTFYTKSIPDFNFLNNDRHFTRLVNNQIIRYDIISGERLEVLLDGDLLRGSDNFIGSIYKYEFSPDEDKILIASETENVFRRSSKSNYYVYHRSSGFLQKIYPNGKVMYASFSPDGTHVGFVHENNLYINDLSSGLITQITFDGKENHIINGASDWAYEEEFSLSKAYFWAPSGTMIAYLKFDERNVKSFQLSRYNGDAYPQYTSIKYPKSGEENSRVSIHIFNLKMGTSLEIDLPNDTDYYIPRLQWDYSEDVLSFTTLNRHQNLLRLYLYDIQHNLIETLIEEKSKYYIDIQNMLYFLPDNKHFLWASDRSGFNRLYLHDKDSRNTILLTEGDYDVSKLYGVDHDKKKVYFQSSTTGPLDRQVYSVDLNSKRIEIVSPLDGWNDAVFSNSFSYYIQTHSTINSPPNYSVIGEGGELIRVIEDNDHVKTLQRSYKTSNFEFYNFTTLQGDKLNGYRVLPYNFDSTKSYPLIMYVYGGPGSQEVTNRWKGDNYWYFQYLAQEGYIVTCIDGRGTGGRGAEFKKQTYLQLGKYETRDQIEAAMYLGREKYIDASRIGIYGWSYGGFVSTKAILKGSSIFKASIAIAPVTNWKWYNTIYSERHMRTEKENPDGYRLNAPVNYAKELEGSYLLIHGTADDNVHFQHSMEMINALINANKHFETYIYPNRNHGIYGNNARLHMYTKITNFIKTNI